MGLILNIDDPRLWAIHHAPDRNFGDEIPGWYRVSAKVPEEAVSVPDRHDQPELVEEMMEFVSSDMVSGDIMMELTQHSVNRGPKRFVKLSLVVLYFTDHRGATAFKLRYA